MQTIEEALAKLNRSKFRSSFHLRKEEMRYIDKHGMERIREHCKDFVAQRLTPAFPENDGKQTPMRGHPVFIAQHACACCCRGCLEKWYRIPQGRTLTDSQQTKVVNLLMAWIEKEYSKEKNPSP